jgi:hypothetical protein
MFGVRISSSKNIKKIKKVRNKKSIHFNEDVVIDVLKDSADDKFLNDLMNTREIGEFFGSGIHFSAAMVVKKENNSNVNNIKTYTIREISMISKKE